MRFTSPQTSLEAVTLLSEVIKWFKWWTPATEVASEISPRLRGQEQHPPRVFTSAKRRVGVMVYYAHGPFYPSSIAQLCSAHSRNRAKLTGIDSCSANIPFQALSLLPLSRPLFIVRPTSHAFDQVIEDKNRITLPLHATFPFESKKGVRVGVVPSFDVTATSAYDSRVTE